MKAVSTVKTPRKGAFTAASARAANLRRAELATQGKIKIGRPKGVLNKETIAAIQSRKTFVEHVSKYAGKITDDLLRNSESGDTRASVALLDRVDIIATQKIEHEHKFSLIGLHDARAQSQIVDGNPDVRAILPSTAQPDIEDDEDA